MVEVKVSFDSVEEMLEFFGGKAGKAGSVQQVAQVLKDEVQKVMAEPAAPAAQPITAQPQPAAQPITPQQPQRPAAPQITPQPAAQPITPQQPAKQYTKDEPALRWLTIRKACVCCRSCWQATMLSLCMTSISRGIQTLRKNCATWGYRYDGTCKARSILSCTLAGLSSVGRSVCDDARHRQQLCR